MMSLKDNNDKKDDKTTTSGALNTEEILSLLSKTSQDFKKEADISENISYLFKKKSLKDIAEASRVSDPEVSEPSNKTSQDTDKKLDEEKEEKKEETVVEKKVLESEAKKMAQAMAKDYYNKGYQLGVKKTKEELEKGEKALAVSFKNLADNIFSVSPEFCNKLNEQLNKNLMKISREMIGYEIDLKTNSFFKKVNDLVDSFEDSIKKVKIFLNKQDFESISKYLEDNKIKIDHNLVVDESLDRGDIKIKSGSIEIGNILSNKIKFTESSNIDDDLENLKKNETLKDDNLVKSEKESKK